MKKTVRRKRYSIFKSFLALCMVVLLSLASYVDIDAAAITRIRQKDLSVGNVITASTVIDSYNGNNTYRGHRYLAVSETKNCAQNKRYFQQKYRKFTSGIGVAVNVDLPWIPQIDYVVATAVETYSFYFYPQTHEKHGDWIYSLDSDGHLVATCGREGCLYKDFSAYLTETGSSASVDSEYKGVFSITAESMEYKGLPYDVNTYIKTTFKNNSYNKNIADLVKNGLYKDGDANQDGVSATFTFVGVDGTVYEESENAPVNAGKYAVNMKVEQNGETLVYSEKFEITKKPVEIVEAPDVTSEEKAYGETLSTFTITGGVVKSGDTTVPGTFKWVDETIIPDVDNFGYDVMFVPEDSVNYGSESVILTPNVVKADYSNITKVQSIKININDEEETNIQLPVIPEGAIYGEVSSDNDEYFTVGEISQDGKLPIKAIKDWNHEDEKSFYINVVGDGNHNGYTITINVRPKDNQIIWAENVNTTYGANDVKVLSSLLVGDGIISYDITEGKEVVDVDENGNLTIKSVGNAKVTVKATQTDDFVSAEKEITVSVDKKMLALAWTNTVFTYNGKEVVPTVVFTNLVGNDVCTVDVIGGKTEVGKGYLAVINTESLSNNNYKLPNTGLHTEFEIVKTKQDKPALLGVDETILNKNDGKISGLTDRMQYREASNINGDYTDITDTGMLFAPGIYEIRYKEDSNHEASLSAIIEIKKGKKLKIILPSEQIGYTIDVDKSEVAWHGNATVTFKILKGYKLGESFSVRANSKIVSLNEENKLVLNDIEGDIEIVVTDVVLDEVSNNDNNNNNIDEIYKNVEPTPGKVADITNTSKVQLYVNDISIKNGSELENLLKVTTEEKAQGVNVWIRQIDISESVSKTDIELIKSVLADNKVAKYMDISLYKKVGTFDVQKVTELNGKIRVEILVPEEFRADNRVYAVVRVHDGKALLISANYNKDTHCVIFETDGFSTYALVYKDLSLPNNKPNENNATSNSTDIPNASNTDNAQNVSNSTESSNASNTDNAQNISNAPNTGNSDMIVFYVIMMIISLMVMILVVKQKKVFIK